jgi:uncharacterized protein (UPF0332 family)
VAPLPHGQKGWDPRLKKAAADFWERAREALRSASHELPVSPDAAASRAYYAALYAVSAWFALDDKIYVKHTAVEAAVHRDLVRPGLVTQEFGVDYSSLMRLRIVGDYGVSEHVSPEQARDAVKCAERILKAVADANPSVFQTSPGT